MAVSSHKRILIGITGSIAAYKIPFLVQLLKRHQFDIKIMLSKNAEKFVTKTTLETLCGHRIYCAQQDDMQHIQLARWADSILIAPATANIIAKLAVGSADELLTQTCLATKAPIHIAPAMNTNMWSHTATQKNIRNLQQLGYQLIDPDHGEQACGDIGVGRMQEPESILARILKSENPSPSILITAGPTHEPIDSVRYLSNRSSGKMGYAIAKAAVHRGLAVSLVSGPTAISMPYGVDAHYVKTAHEMHSKVMEVATSHDIFVSVAAVSDFRFDDPSDSKISSRKEVLDLRLVKNPDIAASVGHLKSKRPFCVAFTLQDMLDTNKAFVKLNEKKCDLIFLNTIGPDSGFEVDENSLSYMSLDARTPIDLGQGSKLSLAEKVMDVILNTHCDSFKT